MVGVGFVGCVMAGVVADSIDKKTGEPGKFVIGMQRPSTPHTCHMQFFRQVLSPLGMYNCPVYRNQPHGRVGGKEAYATQGAYDATRADTAGLISSFDATEQCKEVTCLYNHANWWMEEMVNNPEAIDGIGVSDDMPEDFFL